MSLGTPYEGSFNSFLFSTGACMKPLWQSPVPLVLASKSAARRALLESTGIPFEIVDAEIDERAVEAPLRDAGANAEHIALHLARAKALATSARMPDRLVVGADQTLSLD